MSPNVLEIFAADARKHAERLHSALGSGSDADVEAIRRAARRLHHSAVLANHGPVIHAAAAVQQAAVQVAAGKRRWSDDLGRAIERIVGELATVVASLPEGDSEAEGRLRRAAESLTRDAHESAAPPPAAEPAGGGTPESAGEAEEILSALIEDLGEAVERLQNDPRDRDPLKAMLRKIRRLRELRPMEALSPEDRALSAVEELILQIADLNATVGPGYLTVFRHAREVLEGMKASGEAAPSVTLVGGRAAEVDRLKESVLEKARRSRQVIWVSELFYPEGPHVVECPRAEEEAGSIDAYFLREARERLERSEGLRRTMLEADAEQMRLAGESLAHTLRHLRERAAAFNHRGVGRVTRRAAAALRAQLVRPPSRIRALAKGFEPVFSGLQHYLDSAEPEARSRAIGEAEEALHLALLGGEPEAVATEAAAEFDPDAALKQALALRTRVDERLQNIKGPAADGLREDLEQLFDLIAQYVSASAERH